MELSVIISQMSVKLLVGVCGLKQILKIFNNFEIQNVVYIYKCDICRISEMRSLLFADIPFFICLFFSLLLCLCLYACLCFCLTVCFCLSPSLFLSCLSISVSLIPSLSSSRSLCFSFACMSTRRSYSFFLPDFWLYRSIFSLSYIPLLFSSAVHPHKIALFHLCWF